jgi:hypothetical protein
MTNLEQAARLALEALEEHGSAYLGHETPYSAAIADLRQALEQPANEPVPASAMTLRDYFAANVMANTLALCLTNTSAAEEAYKIADAMLKVRKDQIKEKNT